MTSHKILFTLLLLIIAVITFINVILSDFLMFRCYHSNKLVVLRCYLLLIRRTKHKIVFTLLLLIVAVCAGTFINSVGFYPVYRCYLGKHL